jgi:hypothetical protein
MQFATRTTTSCAATAAPLRHASPSAQLTCDPSAQRDPRLAMCDKVVVMKPELRRRFDRDIEWVKDVLRRWDPIGVFSIGSESPAVDEYDGYASHILSLLYRGASRTEIARHLETLRTGPMGMPPLRSRDEDVAEELLALSFISEPHDHQSVTPTLPEEFSSPAHARVVDDVRAYGWHVMKVLPEKNHPAWAYSIGLFRTFGQPEVIVFGLGGDTMHHLIKNVADRMRSGVGFQDGTSDDELVNGYSCVFRSVPAVWLDETVGFAQWFYGGAGFPVLQLFWPDRNGSLPWEDRCEPGIRALQPRLYSPNAESAGAEWLLT